MVPCMQTSFFGWRIVAGAFVLAIFGWGLGFYGPPIYLHAVEEARGWSVALVSGAVTLHFLTGAVVVANLPRLYRRYGLPAVTKTGAVFLALGVLGWASAHEPWQLLLATLLSGAGWAAMGAAAVNAIIAPWFVTKRPAALSAAYNGASVGGVIFSPLWVAAIAWLGFPTAAIVIGGTMAGVVWLFADRMFSHTPESLGQSPDGVDSAPAGADGRTSGAAPWHDLRFLTLAAAMALGLFAQIGLIAHLFSLITPALGEQIAGIVMGTATAAAIVGRMLVGWLMPAGSDRRLVACANHLVQIIGSVMLFMAAGDDVVLLITGVLLFGVGIGNTTSLPPLIAQAEFDRAEALRVVSLIVAISQGTYAFAPAVFGALRSLSRPEGAAVFVAAAILQGLAILAFGLGRRAVRPLLPLAR